jgi:hypothetical protein
LDSQRNARMLPRATPTTRPIAKPTITSEVTEAVPRK